MSKFNCQVGEAIEFPRHESKRFFKKDKCCGFVGAVLVADAVIGGVQGPDVELPANQVVDFRANTSIRFDKTATGTFATQTCGTYSVTLKARAEAPGGSPIGPFTFRIEVTGCNSPRTIEVLAIPEVRGDEEEFVFVTTKVCLREGEAIRVVSAQAIELTPPEAITLVLSVAKISDCCDGDGNGIVGSCRSCSCSKCDFDHHHGHHSGFGGHHDCDCKRW